MDDGSGLWPDSSSLCVCVCSRTLYDFVGATLAGVIISIVVIIPSHMHNMIMIIDRVNFYAIWHRNHLH